jgi:uncharacterized membrane protein
LKYILLFQERAMQSKKILTLLLCVFFSMSFSVLAAAETDKKGIDDRPEREITMSVAFPGVQVPQGDEVSMDIVFHNRGKKDENVSVWIAEKPKEWKTKIKTYPFEVSSLNVPADSEKTLTFEAKPSEGIRPGDYDFRLEARTEDGRFEMAETIAVTVTAAEKTSRLSRGIKVTTLYPVLEGPVKGKFEFSLDVESQSGKDEVIDLSGQGPEAWDVRFKPAYETKYITSLQMKAGLSSKFSVEVGPPPSALPGEYPIRVRASTANASGETTLKVVLTGSYELKLSTPTGLLSLDARPGKAANVSIYVQNTGTAENRDITFTTFKPENWKVEFKPERVESLMPGDLKQVEVIITPYREALVGDYSVNLQVNGEQEATASMELRVTVKSSTAWGWIGIAIIAVVIGGLVVLFRFLGRR